MAKGKQILGLPRGKHLFGTAKVGEKGQIVIPKEARELFGIKPGDSLLLLGDIESGLAIIKPELSQQMAEAILQTHLGGKEDKQ